MQGSQTFGSCIVGTGWVFDICTACEPNAWVLHDHALLHSPLPSSSCPCILSGPYQHPSHTATPHVSLSPSHAPTSLLPPQGVCSVQQQWALAVVLPPPAPSFSHSHHHHCTPLVLPCPHPQPQLPCSHLQVCGVQQQRPLIAVHHPCQGQPPPMPGLPHSQGVRRCLPVHGVAGVLNGLQIREFKFRENRVAVYPTCAAQGGRLQWSHTSAAGCSW